MWNVLISLFKKYVLIRIVKRILGSFGVLLPIALVLVKALGWPVILALAVLAAPLIGVLMLFGLPLAAAVAVGGGMLGLLFFLLTIGLLIIKVVLVVMLVSWALKWLFGRNRGDDKPAAPTEPPPESGERPAEA